VLGEGESPLESEERIRASRRKTVHRIFRRPIGLKEKWLVTLLGSVVVGVIATLISGFFLAPLSRMGVDVVLRGAPLAWMIQVIPRAGSLLWVQFIADALFWVAISFAVLAVLMHYRPTSTIHRDVPRRSPGAGS